MSAIELHKTNKNDEEEEPLLRPVHTNTFALPGDEAVKLAYAVYNPTKESLLLESEKERTIFAEAFITNPRLGTLADLCARVLAKEYGTQSIDILANDPLKQRYQLEAIDIEQPLEELYQIDDMKFWQRLTLAKTKNPALKFMPEGFNWKNEGITLKYLELVETCPAEFWPEQKMTDLALKVKDFVTEMHIRQLQSMRDYCFERYMIRDSDTDKTTTTDVSYTTDEEQKEITTTSSLVGEEEEEEEAAQVRGTSRISLAIVKKKKRVKKGQEIKLNLDLNDDDNDGSSGQQLSALFPKGSGLISVTPSILSSKQSYDENDDEEDERLLEKRRKQIEERRAERRKRREAQQQRREKREAKKQARQAEANKPKPKRFKKTSFFDLPVEEPIDDEHKKLDRRNLAQYLAFRKKYNYPPEHCHHIDLSFVRHFENLVSFAIEFQPPELKEKYHTRHFNFSHEDVEHLASGIASLTKLRVFRLRESRMDAQKLATLVAVLKELNVEIIDFGHDQLNDDCEDAIFELFQGTNTMIKSLELEGNKLGTYTLRRLGRALKRYSGVLKYLGLARNPIDTEALHGLCSKIVNTPQVEEFCIAGVRFSEMGIFCCISDELITRHAALRSLDIMGMPISARAGELLVGALRTNYKIQNFECRGCNLDESIEMDIALCVERNRYMAKNSFIGDYTKTAADVEKFLKENKNPIYAAALKTIEERNVCLESRPDVAERFSFKSLNKSRLSLNSVEIEENSSRQELESEDTPMSSNAALIAARNREPFNYKPNEFNKEEFYEYIQVPGPAQRYAYFKSKNRTHCAYID